MLDRRKERIRVAIPSQDREDIGGAMAALRWKRACKHQAWAMRHITVFRGLKNARYFSRVLQTAWLRCNDRATSHQENVSSLSLLAG
jgi:hypothetical protein